MGSVALPGAGTSSAASPDDGGRPFTFAMLERALADQSDLSAVERFSMHHDTQAHGEVAARYAALLPTSRPASGQQYAFEVDLDLCTGCKACVAACHSQNGLREGESFRAVGVLQGGSDGHAYQQTVTTACHHCLDPACLHGCPVLAYEKDPETGIVRHLDDQCIGCQYCVFTCPYEVPRFEPTLGIVRKCDMCTGRLDAGEPPACVRACPNGAIAIRVVDTADVARRAEGSPLVPGAPSSAVTRPTTRYRSAHAIPDDVLPADHEVERPSKDHAPLAVMLVLTQLSVGAFAGEAWAAAVLPDAARATFSAYQAPVALGIGLFSLAASVLHLGRPLGAFRAVLGLRRSWLSREIVAFGAFATAAMVHAASVVLAPRSVDGGLGAHVTGAAVVALGALGVFCSAMLYHVTGRRYWHLTSSLTKFVGTTALLGLAATKATLLGVAYGTDSAGLTEAARGLTTTLGLVAALRVGFDLSVLTHARDRVRTPLRRTANLLRGALASVVLARVVSVVVGAFVLPLLFTPRAVATAADLAGAVASLVVLTVSELLDRSLFFRAERSPHMPGGIA